MTAVPRDLIASAGDLARFAARVVGEVLSLRALRFTGESLRQAGILILGSAIVLWGMAFLLGLTCGIEGAYFSRSVGAPQNAGTFSAWCDLREVLPYAFGYMMSAKVGTATAKSMVLNTVMVHLIGMVGTQIFWGSNPRAPIGG